MMFSKGDQDNPMSSIWRIMNKAFLNIDGQGKPEPYGHGTGEKLVDVLKSKTN